MFTLFAQRDEKLSLQRWPLDMTFVHTDVSNENPDGNPSRYIGGILTRYINELDNKRTGTEKLFDFAMYENVNSKLTATVVFYLCIKMS